VSELSAERFVDLDRERFEEVAEGVDLVVDLVGGEILQRSAVTVKEGGIVVVVFVPLPPVSEMPLSWPWPCHNLATTTPSSGRRGGRLRW